MGQHAESREARRFPYQACRRRVCDPSHRSERNRHNISPAIHLDPEGSNLDNMGSIAVQTSSRAYPGGIHVPSLTWFEGSEEQRIDWELQEKHLRFLVDSGLHGSKQPFLSLLSRECLRTDATSRRDGDRRHLLAWNCTSLMDMRVQ